MSECEYLQAHAAVVLDSAAQDSGFRATQRAQPKGLSEHHLQARQHRARTLCGCMQNVQGGCPQPSDACLARADAQCSLLPSDVAYIRQMALREAAQTLKMSAQTLRLHAGEMTAQEMRSVQAVLKWKAAELENLAGA
jgi:hypothetical protein